MEEKKKREDEMGGEGKKSKFWYRNGQEDKRTRGLGSQGIQEESGEWSGTKRLKVLQNLCYLSRGKHPDLLVSEKC